MQNRLYNIGIVFILSLMTTACLQTGQLTPQSNYHPTTPQQQPQPYPNQSYNGIPPNYLPPPGKCRLWYSDRPLEGQPAAGDCKKLKKKVPANATLIYPPNEQPNTQGVNVPPEYMPPPGKCRVWHPELPPRLQPPVGKCKQLQKNMPQSAVLIHG